MPAEGNYLHVTGCTAVHAPRGGSDCLPRPHSGLGSEGSPPRPTAGHTGRALFASHTAAHPCETSPHCRPRHKEVFKYDLAEPQKGAIALSHLVSDDR